MVSTLSVSVALEAPKRVSRIGYTVGFRQFSSRENITSRLASSRWRTGAATIARVLLHALFKNFVFQEPRCLRLRINV